MGFEALKGGTSIDEIFSITRIDRWFLAKLKKMADFEKALEKDSLTVEHYETGKKMGYPDDTLKRLSGAAALPCEKKDAVYKMVDTCGAEFDAETPYFYSTFDKFCESRTFPRSGKPVIMVLGSGPIRIGPTLTALENVELVRDICPGATPAVQALEQVGLLDHKYQFPSQLSGGEQQRVSIARAVSKNPKMLLCDEPTGALDSETGVQILTLLQNLSREQEKTVIIVTHNAALAEAADKVIRLKNGKIRDITVNAQPKAVSEVAW